MTLVVIWGYMNKTEFSLTELNWLLRPPQERYKYKTSIPKRFRLGGNMYVKTECSDLKIS